MYVVDLNDFNDIVLYSAGVRIVHGILPVRQYSGCPYLRCRSDYQWQTRLCSNATKSAS